MVFAAAVLGSWNGNDKRIHSQKKKMMHLSTCPFEVPQRSLVECARVLAVGRECGASSLLQSWGVGGHGNDERTAQFKKKKSRTF
jgi:inhibitor of KinA sporulation pathway (predicted exonuclease)